MYFEKKKKKETKPWFVGFILLWDLMPQFNFVLSTLQINRLNQNKNCAASCLTLNTK